MNSYLLTETAQQDIEEIVSYIQIENPNAALKFANKFYDAIDLLTPVRSLNYFKSISCD